VTIYTPGTLPLINSAPRAEPFDHPDWIFEAKCDDCTVRGQLISRNGNRMQRYAEMLDLLPPGLVLEDDARPLFNELMFGHRRPAYIAFDLPSAEGVDLAPVGTRA